MVNKITTPPTTSELIGTVNEIIDGKQDVISDLATIRSGAALGATALQPSALNGYATQTWVGQQGYITGITSSDVKSALGYTPYDSENPDGYITSADLPTNHVTTNTAQTISGDKKFTGVTRFQNGSGNGCVILGADVAQTTVSAYTRKLGRMSFHTYTNTLDCAFVSTDSDDSYNYVEFGGRSGDTTNTSPDILRFTVANSHNSKNNKTHALEISYSGGANFTVLPKYNTKNLATESYVTTAVSGKQDTLVSGTNIKTINNTSILGSGNIEIQGGGGSSYTAGTGIDITNDVISVTNAISTGAALGATAVQPSDLATVATSGSYSDLTNIPTNLLKNTATASSSLTISGIATNKNGAINIGTSSQATGNYGVSIGSFSYANGSLALGLGYFARATADYAIQLGQGTNSTASTLYVGFNTRNYLLLDGSTGLIPDARIGSNIARSADIPTKTSDLTNDSGFITSSALSGYALDTSVVHKTGDETISGTKTFQGTGWITYMQNTNVTYNTAPSSDTTTTIAFVDKNSQNMGVVECSRRLNNSTVMQLNVYGPNGDWASKPLGLEVNSNGVATAYAPPSDVNDSIVTTVNKSKAANGYFQLGNGMIVNWGSVSSWTSNVAQVTFSKAFTTTRQIAIARSAGAATTNDGGDYFVRGLSNTGFNIYRTSTNTAGVSWIAIGY